MPILCTVCLIENPDDVTRCRTCGSDLDVPDNSSLSSSSLLLPPGTVLKGGYKIDRILGQGGFGITYRAFNTNNVTVAIKELWPDNACRQGTNVLWSHNISPVERRSLIDKFKDEARGQQKCQHPNIARIHDCFEENSTVYIAMEFIEGKSLHGVVKENGVLGEHRAIQIFIQIASALVAIHGNNFLHRDIKPDNIIIAPNDRAVLIDFGAAREFIAGFTGDMTRILTPGYAPLEQYSQMAKRVAASDIYSLCATMYEVLTGQLPVQAPDRAQQIQAHHSDPLIPPRKLRPDLSPLIDRIIRTGMKMNINDRFQSAGDFIKALKGDFISPQHRRAIDLVLSGKLLDSLPIYDLCITDTPDDPVYYLEKGFIQLYLNDTQAEDSFKKGLQLDNKNYLFYVGLSVFYLKQQKTDIALKYFKNAKDYFKNNKLIDINFIWALLYTKQYSQAVNLIGQSDLSEKNIVNQSTIAIASYHRGDWKTFIINANPVIFQANNNPKPANVEIQKNIYPYLVRALERHQSKDLDRKIDEFINRFPLESIAYGLKGYYLARKGDWREADRLFSEAVNLNSNYHWIYINYAIVKENLKDHAGAIEIYTKYLDKFASDPLVEFRLGTLLGYLSRWQQAKSHLEIAVSLKKDYAEAYHNLGWVLLNITNNDGQVIYPDELLKAYRQAVFLYTQQNKLQLAALIKQKFDSLKLKL